MDSGDPISTLIQVTRTCPKFKSCDLKIFPFFWQSGFIFICCLNSGQQVYYSQHPKTGLNLYSNGLIRSRRQTVKISNHDLKLRWFFYRFCMVKNRMVAKNYMKTRQNSLDFEWFGYSGVQYYSDIYCIEIFWILWSPL
jgi:hypothetical protein